MRVLFVLLSLLFLGCNQSVKSIISEEQTEQRIDSPPNILWIVAEDLSHYLPMFGDSTILTPHLSRLASEGVCYDQFFSPAAVCAPARSSITMGMYPTRLGSNHMRTGPWYTSGLSQKIIEEYSKKALPPGINAYEAIAPDGAKMMSEYLRMAGYYCSNNSKEDYQFQKTITAWDDSSRDAHWRNRKDGQAFFSIFNLGITHESQIWARQKDSLWVDEHLSVVVPPYLPNTEVGNRDVRQMYSNIKQMDHQVGELLAELEEDGLLEETIIFWYTDHGGPLPRQKRLLYDSGIHVPMIIRFPNQMNAGTRNDDLLSFIDLAPTVLSLAGVESKSHFDGKAFLGKYKPEQKADYVFAAADRFDESYDAVRAVRDKRFKLIEYLIPEKPMFLKVAYREQMPIMGELQRLRKEGKLTESQALWFRDHKPNFEFFDTWTDPHEVNDLYGEEKYSKKISELKTALQQWKLKTPDPHLQDENRYIKQLWPNNEIPTCMPPVVTIENGTVSILSEENESVGYQVLREGEEPTKRWQIYNAPFSIEDGHKVITQSDRIGYAASPLVWSEN